MPEQTKIKELLKELGKTRVHTDGFDDTLYFRDQQLFDDLKQAIKSLRKENKRLKKQCELQTEGTIQIFDAAMKTLTDRIAKPVAEFKCAKTNKPTLGKTYLIIQEVDGKYRYAPSLLHFSLNSSPEWPYNTVAFTETEPGEIVNALPKTK